MSELSWRQGRQENLLYTAQQSLASAHADGPLLRLLKCGYQPLAVSALSLNANDEG